MSPNTVGNDCGDPRTATRDHAAPRLDPVVYNDWHPVAKAREIPHDRPMATTLMEHDLVLWRCANGTLQAWEDRCPHRGTRLSIGTVSDGALTCVYHGWRFGADARCFHIPAQPQGPVPAAACVKTYAARERYGLVWVCLGQPAGDVPAVEEHADALLRTVICGPYDVASSGPRIIENFLDMAHFGFVHAGILGDLEHTAIEDYRVQALDAGGVLATQCFAWQPRTNTLAQSGCRVEYTYRVVRPLTAILTKLSDTQPVREAISLHVQPLSAEFSRVWIILAMGNFVQSEDELRAFQDTIFLQDRPILENQRPKRLPLRGELSVACDRLSLAYRRYLAGLGLSYGVTASVAGEPAA